MAARLGVVLFWAGFVVAGLIAVCASILLSGVWDWFYGLAVTVAMALSILMGWGARYILAGY